jgi:hypothetical protein
MFKRAKGLHMIYSIYETGHTNSIAPFQAPKHQSRGKESNAQKPSPVRGLFTSSRFNNHHRQMKGRKENRSKMKTRIQRRRRKGDSNMIYSL